MVELSPIFDENPPFSSTWQSNGFTNDGTIYQLSCNYNENANDGSCTYAVEGKTLHFLPHGSTNGFYKCFKFISIRFY